MVARAARRSHARAGAWRATNHLGRTDPGNESRGLRVKREEVGLHNEAQTVRRDRIRWGPIWAGVVTALGSYLFLQLALLAAGIVEIGDDVGDGALLPAIAALIAFFIGGLTTGATTMWQGVDDGILHGIVMWFAGLVLLIVLSAVGSGLALGAFDTSETFDNVTSGQNAGEEVGEDAREAAGWALIGLTLALASAAAGAAVGSKMWPKDDVVVEVARLRTDQS